AFPVSGSVLSAALLTTAAAGSVSSAQDMSPPIPTTTYATASRISSAPRMRRAEASQDRRVPCPVMFERQKLQPGAILCDRSGRQNRRFLAAMRKSSAFRRKFDRADRRLAVHFTSE